ncbi:aldo/keto reductase [Viridibacterium curvum]|uniref:Aldo/keto reductase n=1 Tax=Viridibacterium curvum TaxID=1101404 RepID=A0ABP9QS66_9RHOO
MKSVQLPSGESVPALGLGTWCMGDEPGARAEEIATIQLAIDSGMRVIDTAEMYGEGRAESLVGEAIAGRRENCFLVSKVYPHNASRRGAVQACERSLERLGTDCIDLYLLHWRGNVPLEETLEAFLSLQGAGKIRYFGVSNFDTDDLAEWCELDEGASLATNQVLYNLTRRGVERDLLPWMREMEIPLMAYSPIEQGRLAGNAKLAGFAKQHDMTPAQAALGWLLANEDVLVIPKTGNRARLRENLQTIEKALDEAQLIELDALFPAPKGRVPLEML